MTSHRRLTRWASLLVVVLVPVVAFHRALLGQRTLILLDASEYFLPIYRVVVRTWFHGELPTWNRYAFSGYPLLGSSQGGVFYFPHILFGLIDPRRAHAVLYVGHLIVGGLGARALAKRFWRDDVAAAASGVAFSLNAFAIGHLTHIPMWAAFAFLPWALWGVDHVIDHWRPLPMAVTAGSMAMVAFDGHPQNLWICITALVGFATVRALTDTRRRWSARFMSLGVAASTMILGTGLSAMQLLPVAAYSPNSGRPRLGLTGAMTYSYPTSHLPLLTFPYLFGATARVAPYTDDYKGIWLSRELIGYVGLAALVLAMAGLPLIWRRPAGRALLALLPVQLILILGPSTPIGPWIFRNLPIFDRFRAWGRHVLVIDLAVAVLAGAGVHLMMVGSRRTRMLALGRAGATAGALAIFGIVVQRTGSLRPFIAGPAVRTLAVAVPLLAALGAVAAVAVSLVDRRVAAVLVLMVITADMWAFANSYEWRAFSLTPVAAERVVNDEPMSFGPVRDSPGGIDRFGTDAPLLQMSWVGKRLLSINGFDPLIPLPYATAVGDMVEYGGLRRADLWTTAPAIADLLRITTFVAQAGTTSPAPAPSAAWKVIGPVVGTPMTRYERDPGLAEAFVVGASQRVSFNEEVTALRTDPTLDPANKVLFDGECRTCPSATAPGPAGAVPHVRWGEKSVDMDVVAQRSAVLVVSQAWSPGWKATVDGKSTSVVRVYGLVTGVAVPTGRHRVKLRYEAPGLRAGLLVSLLSMLIIIGALMVSLLNRRGAPRSGRERRLLVSWSRQRRVPADPLP